MTSIPANESDLETMLSAPDSDTVEALGGLEGDVLVLGAGGKMGPTLARMARRAIKDKGRRVIAVSRFSDAAVADALREHGVEILRADLSSVSAFATLPKAPNVIWMAGQKFGTSNDPVATWTQNVVASVHAAEYFTGSRIVCFSTGNVYAQSTHASSGSLETDALLPSGEYAASCVGRERVFEAAARRHGCPLLLFRLFYACDLRYGVVTDIALRVLNGQPVDLTTEFVNAIWQGDANRLALRALAVAESPPVALNVTGAICPVREIATLCGGAAGIEPAFSANLVDNDSRSLIANTDKLKRLIPHGIMDLKTLCELSVKWILSTWSVAWQTYQIRCARWQLLITLSTFRRHLLHGWVIPAHPLALHANRTLDEQHQRALTRYYVDAGAGGIAVGVHTTGFPIHDAKIGLYKPVLELAIETAYDWIATCQIANPRPTRPLAMVAGLIGDTRQAVREAAIARELGYHCGLLSLGAWRDADEAAVLKHCRHVADVIPLFGFYLQPAVGGRRLSFGFWREFAEIASVVAIKVAPFDRYATLDVIRAVGESGRDDIALYTGNDDAIVADLLMDVPVSTGGIERSRHFVGGLLGQWAVWTRRAVEFLDDIRAWRSRAVMENEDVPREWLARGAALTMANAAIFDAANGYRGCLPGILEVLRGQKLVRGTWTFDVNETLSDRQSEEIGRLISRFPELTDDDFRCREYRSLDELVHRQLSVNRRHT